MIVAIDGTGPDSPGDYAKEMGGSFCSQIGRTANATYFRGTYPDRIGDLRHCQPGGRRGHGCTWQREDG